MSSTNGVEAKGARSGPAVGIDAEALAAGMGMRLGSLIEVSATGPMQAFNNQFINVSRGFDMGPGQPPEVIINASVTVRYRLQPR